MQHARLQAKNGKNVYGFFFILFVHRPDLKLLLLILYRSSKQDYVGLPPTKKQPYLAGETVSALTEHPRLSKACMCV